MTWKQAFSKQAQGDYKIFLEFNNKKNSVCHQLHYLQMATEKLAKVFRCDNRNNPPTTTHNALVKFLRQSKTMPRFYKKMGFKNKNQYSAHIDSILPIAQEIQNLAPVGTNMRRPNPEYPWLSDGSVVAPVDYNFNNIYRYGSKLYRFQKFIDTLFKSSLI